MLSNGYREARKLLNHADNGSEKEIRIAPGI
jgi:hypothetical protein